ncbi:hypothetical protein HDU76_009414, partial [Blyttiomyces sp. JEL0837]
MSDRFRAGEAAASGDSNGNTPATWNGRSGRRRPSASDDLLIASIGRRTGSGGGSGSG